MKRNVLNSPRLLELKKSRRRATEKKIFILFLVFIVIFGLLVYVSRLKNLNIVSVEVTGNKVVDTESIQKAISVELTGKYLWLFPKTNILLYPKNSIQKDLQSQFKRLESVNTSIKDNKILEVSVSERTAQYIWCGTNPPYDNSPDAQNPDSSGQTLPSNCYFLDENGYVFDEAPYFSGNVYFKFYGLDDLNANNPLGGYFAKKYFNQLISFKDALINLGLKPISLYVANDGNVDIFLSGENALVNGPEILLNTGSDFQSMAENLQAALTTEPLQSEFKNKYDSLLYIDLRFKDKVYYKFK